MSGFAVMVQLGAMSAPRRVFAELVDRLRHRGPDGCEIRWLPRAALAHQHFWTTPEEVGEIQPLAKADAELYLSFDGRLDNRDELLTLLDLRSASGLSDAALVLESYRRWGRECLARLLGPFALALYDAKRRALLCGRDALGDRSLFYARPAGAFLAASEEQALLAHPSVAGDPDEESLARFFACREPRAGRTFYAAIRELPPGHGLWLEDGAVELFQYWAPDWTRRLQFRREADYQEHFRELLERSVQRRLRTAASPAVLMSGGLDSTSVAALASRRLEAAGRPRLTAVTWIFDELVSCDERSFARAVAERSRLDSIELPADGLWPRVSGPGEPMGCNSPTVNPYRRLLDRAYRAAGEAGCRSVLTGWSGDHLWIGTERWLADLLREGRFAEAGREVLSELARGASPRRGAGPVAELLRLRRRRSRATAEAFPWLTAQARRHLRATEEAEAEADERSQRFAGLQVWNLVAERGQAARSGADPRHPYRDRELVEAMLAMPAHQLYRRGRSKHLLREALAGELPTEIRTSRGDRGRLDALFRRGLFERERGRLTRLLDGQGAVWRRYVDPHWVRQAMGRDGGFGGRGGRGGGLEAVILWSCASAEIWHRRSAA
ncbi:MAG: asparagine synthase-related protein [Acidobacteriota bacterium]|nr:asparagine synthase-related protein [Acidobacteriota bacterium]